MTQPLLQRRVLQAIMPQIPEWDAVLLARLRQLDALVGMYVELVRVWEEAAAASGSVSATAVPRLTDSELGGEVRGWLQLGVPSASHDESAWAFPRLSCGAFVACFDAPSPDTPPPARHVLSSKAAASMHVQRKLGLLLLSPLLAGPFFAEVCAPTDNALHLCTSACCLSCVVRRASCPGCPMLCVVCRVSYVACRMSCVVWRVSCMSCRVVCRVSCVAFSGCSTTLRPRFCCGQGVGGRLRQLSLPPGDLSRLTSSWLLGSHVGLSRLLDLPAHAASNPVVRFLVSGLRGSDSHNSLSYNDILAACRASTDVPRALLVCRLVMVGVLCGPCVPPLCHPHDVTLLACLCDGHRLRCATPWVEVAASARPWMQRATFWFSFESR